MSLDHGVALESQGVWFSYRAGAPALRGVDMVARSGEVTALLGPSGSGKTTLLKIWKGLIAPSAGRALVLGELVAAPGRGRLDPRVAYIPQQLGLVRALSVLDNVLTGALARVGGLASLARLFPEDELIYARALLERLGIERLADQSAYAVSGGERQRVAIARALMQRPRILLADEFVSQLDHTTARGIMRSVADVAAEGVAVVIATHELDVVRTDVQRLVLLRGGEKTLDVAAHQLDEVAAALP